MSSCLQELYMFLTETKDEADRTVGPVHTLQHFKWKDYLLITENPFFQLHN